MSDVTIDDVVPLTNSAMSHIATCTRYFMEAHSFDQATALFLLHTAIATALFDAICPEKVDQIRRAVAASNTPAPVDNNAALSSFGLVFSPRCFLARAFFCLEVLCTTP